MFLEMYGAGCADCGRPVTAWVDRMMWPCGCPALGGAPPSGDGEPAAVLSWRVQAPTVSHDLRREVRRLAASA